LHFDVNVYEDWMESTTFVAFGTTFAIETIENIGR
jgi:hypothetical protein